MTRRKGGNILGSILGSLGQGINQGLSGLLGGRRKRRRRRGGAEGEVSAPPAIAPPTSTAGKINKLLHDSQIISGALGAFGGPAWATDIAGRLGYGRRRRRVGRGLVRGAKF